jgi:hypothetical protein
VSASLNRDRNCLSGKNNISVYNNSAQLGSLLTENFYRLVLEIVLSGNAAQVGDMELVVDLIKNDHVGLCKSAASSPDQAISLVDKLRVFLEHVMFHTYKPVTASKHSGN